MFFGSVSTIKQKIETNIYICSSFRHLCIVVRTNNCASAPGRYRFVDLSLPSIISDLSTASVLNFWWSTLGVSDVSLCSFGSLWVSVSESPLQFALLALISSFGEDGVSGRSLSTSANVSFGVLRSFLFLLRIVPSSLFTRYDLMPAFLSTFPFFQRPERSCLLGCMRTTSFFWSSGSSLLPQLKYLDCVCFLSLSFSPTPFCVSGFRSWTDIGSKVLMRRPNILRAGDESIPSDGVFLHSGSAR